MNRREFGKILFKGTLVSIIAPNVLTTIANKTQAPVLTTLGRELTEGKLLSPGWHRVVIENILESPSKRDDSINIQIVMRAVDEDAMRISQFINEKHPYPILDYLSKASIEIENDSVDLNNLLGKEINIEVQKIIFKDKEMRMVKS